MMILKSNSLKSVTVLAMLTFHTAAASWKDTGKPEKGRCIQRLDQEQKGYKATTLAEEQAEYLRYMQKKMKKRMVEDAKYANTGEISDSLINIFGKVPAGPCDADTMRLLLNSNENEILSISSDNHIIKEATQRLYNCINNENLDENIVYRIARRYDTAIETFGMLKLLNIKTRRKMEMLEEFIQLDNPENQMQLMEKYLLDYKIIDDSWEVAQNKLNKLSEEIQRKHECGAHREDLYIFAEPDERFGMAKYEAVVQLFLIHGQYAKENLSLEGDELIETVQEETFGDFEWWKLNVEGDADFGWYMNPLVKLPYEII